MHLEEYALVDLVLLSTESFIKTRGKNLHEWVAPNNIFQRKQHFRIYRVC